MKMTGPLMKVMKTRNRDTTVSGASGRRTKFRKPRARNLSSQESSCLPPLPRWRIPRVKQSGTKGIGVGLGWVVFSTSAADGVVFLFVPVSVVGVFIPLSLILNFFPSSPVPFRQHRVWTRSLADRSDCLRSQAIPHLESEDRSVSDHDRVARGQRANVIWRRRRRGTEQGESSRGGRSGELPSNLNPRPPLQLCPSRRVPRSASSLSPCSTTTAVEDWLQLLRLLLWAAEPGCRRSDKGHRTGTVTSIIIRQGLQLVEPFHLGWVPCSHPRTCSSGCS